MNTRRKLNSGQNIIAYELPNTEVTTAQRGRGGGVTIEEETDNYLLCRPRLQCRQVLQYPEGHFIRSDRFSDH